MSNDVYREVKYFDGLFIDLSCGHRVWKGTPEFQEWLDYAMGDSPTFNHEKAKVAKCPECTRGQEVGLEK